MFKSWSSEVNLLVKIVDLVFKHLKKNQTKWPDGPNVGELGRTSRGPAYMFLGASPLGVAGGSS